MAFGVRFEHYGHCLKLGGLELREFNSFYRWCIERKKVRTSPKKKGLEMCKAKPKTALGVGEEQGRAAVSSYYFPSVQLTTAPVTRVLSSFSYL